MFRLTIFFAILLIVYFFLGFTWLGLLPFEGIEKLVAWLLLFTPFGSIIWLFTVLWQKGEAELDTADKFFQWIIFLGIGLASFLFVIAAMRSVLQLVFTLVGASKADEVISSPPMFWVVFICAVLSVFIGALIARLRLEVTSTDIIIDRLPKELDGFRIAQISDLHIGSTIGTRFVNRVVSKVNDLEADAIVLTGDIVDGYFSNLKTEVALLGGLRAGFGRFYITGNHEYYWGAQPIIDEFRRLGFSVLLNSNEILKKNGVGLAIAGVPDYMSETPKPDPKSALQGVPHEMIKILLAHQPSFAQEAAEAGYDVMLSGHTHGGQFFPWTIAVHLFHRFSRGLGRLNGMWIYVNRGTGYWGPPIRLGSSPEISILRLRSRRK